MWGTLPRLEDGNGNQRFIPTHVGNTVHSGILRRSWPVHPHACGEHVYLDVGRKITDGSSPRMWGTRRSFDGRPRKLRFIPTHVGNTKEGENLLDIIPVHPHACGEHSPGIVPLQTSVGSSPRMWGTPSPFFDYFPNNGSSPRMWGTRERRRHSAARYRFIPTHVGNTTLCQLPNLHRPVHPHACGEHMDAKKSIVTKDGSSPRMWGTPPQDFAISLSRRFIPTHVGNTHKLSIINSHRGVHPHACGEHSHGPRRFRGESGSSPRMWGTPFFYPFDILFDFQRAVFYQKRVLKIRHF